MKTSKQLIEIYLFLFALFFLSHKMQGQNMVPNGDFEQFINCPTSINQLTLAAGWINPATNSTPDYFNICGTGLASVPNNFFGSQMPHSGAGYCGLIHYYPPSITPDYREYAEVQLTSPLQPGECYHFEMYVSMGENGGFSTDDIAVYFSDTLIANLPYYTNLPFTPQINNSLGIISDTSNWVLFSGNYQATGGESYLLFGNYKNDLNTTLVPNGFGSLNQAYYYFDDVSLTPCTGINDHAENSSDYILFPNPVKDELKVSGLKFKVGETGEIIITDILGKEVLRKQTNLQSSIFNLQSFNPGIYFVEIRNGDPDSYRERKKFVKE